MGMQAIKIQGLLSIARIVHLHITINSLNIPMNVISVISYPCSDAVSGMAVSDSVCCQVYIYIYTVMMIHYSTSVKKKFGGGPLIN